MYVLKRTTFAKRKITLIYKNITHTHNTKPFNDKSNTFYLKSKTLYQKKISPKCKCNTLTFKTT
jgi:hypothetical protein